jgi:hypothetical protein
MITQPTILELAKQGNPKAIAALMNRYLQAQGVTAKVSIKGNCLRVMLESKQVPKEEALVKFIRQGLLKLEVASITTVQVYGKQVGKEFPAWIQDFKLLVHPQTIPENPLPNEDLKITSSDNNSIITEDLSPPIQNCQEKASETSERPYPINLLKNFDYRTHITPFLRLKEVYRFLVVLIGLQLTFNILFVFYSLTLATSFTFLTFIKAVDPTGAIAKLLYGLFKTIHSLRSPLNSVEDWIYLFTLLLTLVWLHRLHAKLNVLFKDYPISAWGAIARFLIPLYSFWGIWNLFTTLANRLKSQSSLITNWGLLLKGWIPWFYVTFIISNIFDQVYSSQSERGYKPGFYPWFFVIDNILKLSFSIVFLQIVKLITKAVIYKEKQVNGNKYKCAPLD